MEIGGSQNDENCAVNNIDDGMPDDEQPLEEQPTNSYPPKPKLPPPISR